MKRLLGIVVMALLAGAGSLAAQERQITGTVIGAEQNRPLPFATVSLAGTSQTVGTDAQGRFSISAPAGEVRLRVGTLGFKSQEIVVPAGQNTVTVRLETDVLNLEGIVVTGQATSVARRNLANGVSTVTSEQIDRAPPSETVEKMLQGKLAGALIETNSGAPGGGVQVRLRGVSTINGENEPLYVVDGVVISNVAIASNANAVTEASGGSNPQLTQDALVNRAVDINPNDIESIEILKGASAAALYGSRAANGVILITTKRGNPGATRVSFTQRFGTFRLSNRLRFRDWTLDEATAVFGPGVATYFGSNGKPLATYDHEKELAHRTPLSGESVMSVSGGDGDTRYFVSGTWKSDVGIIDNTGFDKQAVRVNLEQTVGERLTINANTNVIHTLAQRGLTNNDNSGTSYYMVLPFTPSFFDLRAQADGLYPDNAFERSNPLQTAALAKNDETVWRLFAGGNAQLEAVNSGPHSLTLLATGGADWFSQKNDLFFPPELQFEPADGLPGTSLLSNSDNLDLTVSGNAIYGYRSGGISSTTTAGVQYENRDQNIARISAFGLTAGQPNVDAGVVQQIREQRQQIRDLGFFGQEEMLLFDERMLVSAGIRADRSSVNGDPGQFFVYPKAAASYRFDDVMSSINSVKLRAAYGQSGNQPLYGQKFTPLTATSNIEGLPD